MKKLGFFLSFCLLALSPSVEALAAVTIPFTITLSEAATVTGTPRVAVDVGGTTRYAVYSAGSGTNTLTFTLSPQAGDVDLDGVTVSSPIDLNGGAIKDLAGNDLTPLTFTPPNTSGIKIDYPSLGMDFVYDADGRYTLNGTAYNDLTSFLSAAGGTFTRASIGTYYDSSGTLQSAASGVPRFDWDPVTHAAKGILIEESRSNIFLRSDDFSHAAWTKTNATVSANAVTAPDGTMSADKLISTVTTAQHYIGQGGLTSGTTYTVSVYAKGAEEHLLALDLAFNSGGSTFDLTTGTVTATSSGTATITSVGNGWYRCSITVVAPGTTAALIQLRGWATSYAGDGASGLYIWGAQLETGALPTSYVPTTSAALTRAADILGVPTSSWHNSTQGTLYTKGRIPYLGWNNTPRMASLSDLSANNVMDLYVNDAGSDQNRAVIYNGGVQEYLASLGTYIAGSLFKGALAYSAATTNASINGLISSSASATVPNVTNLYIGNRYDGNRGANGWIENTRYYPARILDAQLQLLTQ